MKFFRNTINWKFSFAAFLRLLSGSIISTVTYGRLMRQEEDTFWSVMSFFLFKNIFYYFVFNILRNMVANHFVIGPVK